MKTLMKIILAILGLPKSLWLNYRSLPLAQAIRLPIILSPLTKIVSSHGSIDIQCPVKTGMITFGLSGFGLTVNEACIIQNNGRIVFNGKTNCGGGTRVSCNHGGEITFGADTVITGRCLIVSSKHISFGENCLIAWNTQFMDTDLHSLNSEDGSSNKNRDIIIGERVWVCSNVTVNKGACIPAGCVIGSHSLVFKEYELENCLISGIPASIRKKDIHWSK